jgi:surfactin family lipopeptide synthetase A
MDKVSYIGQFENLRLEKVFEKCVAANPQSCALLTSDDDISYADLNSHSNQIAHCLIEKFGQKQSTIILLVQSNRDLIASQLAVLKSQNHFVCLDPCHPSERLISIIKEIDAKAIIVDDCLIAHPNLSSVLAAAEIYVFSFKQSEQPKDIPLLTSLDKLSDYSEQNPQLNEILGDSNKNNDIVDADEYIDPLAYIAFTSGSTGTPKGIIQSHRSFCQFLTWQAKQFNLAPGQRMIQWASASYDASLCEIFGALCFGATLCVEEPAVRYNPLLLIQWVNRVKADVLQVVPSFCRQIVEVLEQNLDDDLLKGSASMNMECLSFLMLAGEALPSDLAMAWKKYSHCRIFNLYGPSETVLATYHEFTEKDCQDSIVSIGKAIDGRNILILNDKQLPSEQGEHGELYIQSHFLTEGYFKREQQTLSHYITDKVNKQFNPPVFRTGDTAYFDKDQQLRFVGRKDNLVKLRGMRVELGEIESVVRRQQSVKECVVRVCTLDRDQDRLTAKDKKARNMIGAGIQLLVAYITTSESIEPSELRAKLKNILPLHMVPQRFIWLDKMPMNANRKLDHKALPKPEKSRPELDVAYLAPTNSDQTRLLMIWSKVFGFEGVGVRDPFLELGGDSLLAMQIVNQINQEFGVQIKAPILMKNVSVEQLEIELNKTANQSLLPALTGTNEPSYSQSDEPLNEQSRPLTHAQWGLWYLWKLDPDNPFYTAQGSIHIQGTLCLTSFAKAWQLTVLNHQVLRTRFTQSNGQPAQNFTDDRAKDYEWTDLSHLNTNEATLHMDNINKIKGKKAFHLENDQLLNLELFRLSSSHHEFVFTYQEIIFDLWGFAIIIKDLMDKYKALKENPKYLFETPQIHFSDFIEWEQQNISSTNLSHENKFWREQLSGPLPVIDLPLDFRRQSKPDYSGDGESVLLSAELSDKLRQLSRRYGTTLYTTILSAFYLTLRQHSHQKDIIIGTPIANRSLSGTENLVGWFLNMLPVRLNFEKGITFEDLLEDTRKVSSDCISNANYPFRWMLEWADISRDSSVAPVFQVMFNWQNLPQTAPNIEGLSISSSEVDSTFKKYDLALYAQEHLDRIYLQFSYLTAIFKPSKIRRMLNNFVETLSAICLSPESPIENLMSITQSEQKWLLKNFNSTESNYLTQNSITQTNSEDSTIDLLFTQQVKNNPLATAFIFEEKKLSYKDLAQRSNQIAIILLKKRIVAQQRVTLCLARGPDMIATILAVAKLGAVHVALDPHFPQKRLESICEDVKPEVHIYQQATAHIKCNAEIQFCLDSESLTNQIDNISDKYIQEIKPTNLQDAFNIVYTSGSTGKPKGVVISHQSVMNRLHWMWLKFPFKQTDVAVLQKSYSIVASNWEILGALLQGIPTLILGRNEVLDANLFWKACITNKVSYLLASPALLTNVLLKAEAIDESSNWKSLRLATTSAEPITPEMIARWYVQFPKVPLLNLFGSTECSSNAAYFDTRNLKLESQLVPIGKPIANTKIYLLDDDLKLVPKGVIGEMCVSGDCVAKEYFNQPELTQKTFLNNPFENENENENGNGRYRILCRTGDAALINEEGYLELVSRKDSQIKIRGFRVELGDIESAANQFVKIEKSVAVAYQTARGLAIALFIESKNCNNADELRAYLVDLLPDYMLPSQLIFLEAIPLTESGKIDRNQLPAIEQQNVILEKVMANTFAEKLLVEVWSGLLDVDSLGIENDFFELGGHSLVATEMVAKLHDIFQIELPIRAIFEAPTISQLIKGPLSELLGNNALVEEVAEIWLSIESEEQTDG